MHAELEEVFLHKGLTFLERHFADTDHEAPVPVWSAKTGDIVSEWVERDPTADERVLVRSGSHRARYYDMAESRRLAMVEGISEVEVDAAVETDFRFVRGWYSDEWHYIGVEVCLQRLPGQTESLWGIESSEDGYQRQVRQDLADELIRTLPERIDRDIARLQEIRELVQS